MTSKFEHTRIAAVKFSYNVYQCAFYRECTYAVLMSNEPLYVSFKRDNFLVGEKAFKEEHCFCLMNSKEVLQQKIDKRSKSLHYSLPSAQDLWNVIMFEIICQVKSKIESYKF